MENHSLTMIRQHMDQIPEFSLPPGIGIRTYNSGEGYIWTRIQRAAETFFEIDDQLFNREFSRDFKAMEDRCFFLITDQGEEIGTATAWWKPTWKGQEWGQIHWVAITPDYQRRGLSKPMLSVAMRRLKQSHERCFLSTSSRRIAAIKVYFDFGFYPDFESENSREVWTEVASVLDHATLRECGFQPN